MFQQEEGNKEYGKEELAKVFRAHGIPAFFVGKDLKECIKRGAEIFFGCWRFTFIVDCIHECREIFGRDFGCGTFIINIRGGSLRKEPGVTARVFEEPAEDIITIVGRTPTHIHECIDCLGHQTSVSGEFHSSTFTEVFKLWYTIIMDRKSC